MLINFSSIGNVSFFYLIPLHVHPFTLRWRQSWWWDNLAMYNAGTTVRSKGELTRTRQSSKTNSNACTVERNHISSTKPRICCSRGERQTSYQNNRSKKLRSPSCTKTYTPSFNGLQSVAQNPFIFLTSLIRSYFSYFFRPSPYIYTHIWGTIIFNERVQKCP